MSWSLSSTEILCSPPSETVFLERGENLSSFSRSDRGLYLYPADSLASGAIASTNLDVSPSTLIPYYDPDTSVVILTGKVNTPNSCV